MTNPVKVTISNAAVVEIAKALTGKSVKIDPGLFPQIEVEAFPGVFVEVLIEVTAQNT